MPSNEFNRLGEVCVGETTDYAFKKWKGVAREAARKHTFTRRLNLNDRAPWKGAIRKFISFNIPEEML